ncbi:MAG: thiamine pyrophosphate-dependent enzyme [Elusimicrobiota bacterium]
MEKDILLEIFRRICLVRYFELDAIDAFREKFITNFLYLSSGEESIPAAMSLIIPEFMIFAQHRCHAVYLTFGGDPEKLRDELLGLPTGTSGGRAGSNCIQCHENNITMFGHHGLIGENVPQAVGAALGSGKPVVTFFGDGAAEEDYIYPAMGFAVTHKLPVLFVCEDNNLSILTTVQVRRSWSVTNVAKALGMPAVDISDDPWTIYKKTQELKNNLPAFMNIHTCRIYWHNSVGIDGPPEWDRFQIVKDDLKKLGLLQEAKKIENEIKLSMEKLWDRKLLQKLLKR